MTKKPKRIGKRITLAPLTPDEALKLALQVKPDPKPEKDESRKPGTEKGRE